MESNDKQLTRSTTDRVIAGVAGGLAEYFAVDVTLIRILFIVLTLAGGPGIVLYGLLWLVMPGSGTRRYVHLSQQEYDKPKHS
jgi:phage shock protein C